MQTLPRPFPMESFMAIYKRPRPLPGQRLLLCRALKTWITEDYHFSKGVIEAVEERMAHAAVEAGYLELVNPEDNGKPKKTETKHRRKSTPAKQ